MPIILPFCLITNLFPNRSGLSNIIDIWHNSWIFWNPPSVFIEASPVSDSKINLFFGLSIKIQIGFTIDVLLCLGITLFFLFVLKDYFQRKRKQVLLNLFLTDYGPRAPLKLFF